MRILLQSLGVLYLALTFAACENKSDNYYWTDRQILTDKEVYALGDTILLSLKVVPLERIKAIRYYANYKNFPIFFTLINDSLNLYNSYGSASSGENLPAGQIIEKCLSSQKPLNITLKGKISQEGDSLIIEFPNLDYRAKFPLSIIEAPGTIVRIHGKASPIQPEMGASLEEYFEAKDIKIRAKR